MVMLTVVLCLLSVFCGIAQFSIGVVAAVNDRSRSNTGELSWDDRYLDNDIYYRRNDPFHYLYDKYCTDTEGAFTWANAWGPVDVLLLLVGAIEAIFAVITCCFGCKSVCSGNRYVNITMRAAYLGREGTASYYNEGFDVKSKISEPTFYKVVPSRLE
jgi:hypothetical protein